MNTKSPEDAASQDAGEEDELVSVDHGNLSAEHLIAAALQTEHVEISVRIAPRLKLGVALVASAFMVSLVGGPIVGLRYGAKWFVYAYVFSWMIFLVGVAIGGPAANTAVKNWRVRVSRTLSERIRSRFRR